MSLNSIIEDDKTMSSCSVNVDELESWTPEDMNDIFSSGESVHEENKSTDSREECDFTDKHEEHESSHDQRNGVREKNSHFTMMFYTYSDKCRLPLILTLLRKEQLS